jgi:hypothetical protein
LVAAGASVVGVLGLAFAVAYSRRSPKQKLVSPVYHDEAVEVQHNPSRAPLERQRSMTHPIEQIPPYVPNVTSHGTKNPFAAKPMMIKFTPTQIRTNYDAPPPPPPPPAEDI